ncbi:MAG: two-component regulator propeller domain-containing protein, partial [Rhodanobacter sp.]
MILPRCAATFSGKSPLKCFALLAFALLSVGAQARQAALPSPFDDYDHVAWTQKDGAPTDVYTMAQTSDGWLWLGSPQGLFRFDGIHFERHDLLPAGSVASRAVHALSALGNGDLWVMYAAGGASVRRASDPQHPVLPPGLPPSTQVDQVIEDAHHLLWALASGRLYRLDAGRWVGVGQAALSLPRDDIIDVVADRSGTFWAMTSHELFRRAAGDTLFNHVHQDQPAKNQNFYLDRAGQVWRNPAHGVLKRLARSNDPSGERPQSGYLSVSLTFLLDARERLWVITGSDGGICLSVSISDSVCSERDHRYTPDDGLSGPAMTMLQDRDGNIWVSTKRGLDRFRLRAVHVVHFPGSVAYFSPVADGQGRVWTGTASSSRLNGWWTLQDQMAKRFLNFVHDVTAVWPEHDGSIVLGGDDGLWRFAGGQMVSMPRPEGIVDARVQAIARDGSDRLWVAFVKRGLYAFDGKQWRVNGDLHGLPELPLERIVPAPDGRLWFSYQNNHVAILDHDHVRTFGPSDGLSLGNVTALLPGSPTLAGGELGLEYFDGRRFRPVLSEPADAFSGITGLLHGVSGDLWVNGSAGLVHVSAAALKRGIAHGASAMPVRIYDSSDGMPGGAQQVRPLPTLMHGTDGKIWIAATDGLAWLDPATVKVERRPPPVLILSLQADGKSYATVGSILLPPQIDTLNLEYTALNLTMPKRTRFRYRLVSDGDRGDTQWQDAGSRREAIYTHLAPGSYRFNVIAVNQDGTWNKAGATLEFEVAPTFFQTGWFVTLCVLAAFAVMWLAVFWRLRQLKVRIRLKVEARHEERERIAHELHDTLMQGMQGMLLRLQTWSSDASLGPEHRGDLQRTATQAHAMMVEGRDKIIELRRPSARQ